MNELSKKELNGFKLFSDMLANKAILTESEKMLVSSFIAHCINNRAFTKRFNEALPKILEKSGNDPDIYDAALLVLEIAFRTRRSDEMKDVMSKAVASYKKLKASV